MRVRLMLTRSRAALSARTMPLSLLVLVLVAAGCSSPTEVDLALDESPTTSAPSPAPTPAPESSPATTTPTAPASTPTPTPSGEPPEAEPDLGPEIRDVTALSGLPPVWLAGLALGIGSEPIELATMDAAGTAAASFNAIPVASIWFPFDISGDGTFIAHGIGTSVGVIHIRDLEGVLVRELRVPENVLALTWSPSGEELGYIGCGVDACRAGLVDVSDGVVARFEVDGIDALSLRPDVRWGGDALYVLRSTDSDDLAAPARLIRVPVDGSPADGITSLDIEGGGGFDVTPDGSLAVVTVPARPAGILTLIDLITGETTPLDAGPPGRDPHFSPDGSAVAYVGAFDFLKPTRVWLASIDGESALELDRSGPYELVAWPPAPSGS